jgi:hypothetical protein
MQEGWWINYDTGKDFYINDHELWIRESGNADKAGVPKSVQKNFAKFKVREDREKFLVYIMQNAPLMRMRGHGVDITFEFYNRHSKAAIEAAYAAAHDYGGQLSTLNIYNLATNEFTSVTREEFDRLMDEDGYEGVMRAASQKFSRGSKAMMGELLKIAREIAAS